MLVIVDLCPGGLLGSDWGPEAPSVKGGAAKLRTIHSIQGQPTRQPLKHRSAYRMQALVGNRTFASIVTEALKTKLRTI